jgi:transposase-like protein
MPNRGKYDKDIRVNAVRLVREHAGDYPTEWAAITAVSSRLGISSDTLHKWVRQAEVDEDRNRLPASAQARHDHRRPSHGPATQPNRLASIHSQLGRGDHT